jgi:hypothetical protein
MNRLLERESMANPKGKLGIIRTSEMAFASPPLSATIVGPNGHHIDPHLWEHETGSVNTPTHVLTNGMSTARSHPCGADSSLEFCPSSPHGVCC